jgi:hypothetical protein
MVHCVASKLINDYGIEYKNIKFLSGALPIIENYHLYNRHTRYNNWMTLDCTLVNHFEVRMQKFITSLDFREHNINIINRKRRINRPKIFTFLNGGARIHRLYLFAHIVTNNLLDKGYVSMHTSMEAIKYVRNRLKLEQKILPDLDDLLDKIQLSNISLPLLQTIQPNDNASQHIISNEDLHLFDTSYFSIIGETLFFKRMMLDDSYLYHSHLDGTFITEKTYRAIACQHPFIMVSRPNTLKHLRRFGYKTFSPYIDETYDDIEDDRERLVKIAELVKDLCNKPPSFWRDFVQEIRHITKHNFDVLMNAKPTYFTQKDFIRLKAKSGL